MAYSHYPEDTSWQCLTPPVSMQEFLAQPHVFPDAFFGLGLDFCSSTARPTGAIVLRGSNQGNVSLKVPKDLELMACLDGDEMKCFQEVVDSNASANTVSIHFRTPKGPQEHTLTIYARRDPSGSGSYRAACDFSVVGSVGPTGFMEPYFPRIFHGP